MLGQHLGLGLRSAALALVDGAMWEVVAAEGRWTGPGPPDAPDTRLVVASVPGGAILVAGQELGGATSLGQC